MGRKCICAECGKDFESEWSEAEALELRTMDERVPQDLCEACAHPDRHHFEDGHGNIICRSTADCACVHRVEDIEEAEDETPVFQIQGFEDDY